MKTNLIMIIGAVVVVIIGAVFFLSKGGESDTQPEAVTSAPATATTLAPDMTIAASASVSPQVVASTTQVYVGNTLATSKNGRGLLQESNGTATVLDYDTTFTLEESDGSGTRVSGFLGSGAMWARVEKVFGKGEYYKIRTQNAVAVVRGTSFGLSYKGGVSKIQVATGTVGLMPADPATGEPIEEKEVSIAGGNKATIDASGTVRVSALTADDKWSSWYLYNEPSTVPDTPEVKAPAPAAPPPAAPATQTAPKTGTAPSSGTPAPPAPPASTAGTVSEGNSCASFSESGGPQASGSLKLTSVSPFSVSKSSQSTVTLTGDGFDCVMTVTIGGKILSGEGDFIVVNNSKITFSSGLLPVGTFDIVIDDSLGNTATLPQAITITQ